MSLSFLKYFETEVAALFYLHSTLLLQQLVQLSKTILPQGTKKT